MLKIVKNKLLCICYKSLIYYLSKSYRILMLFHRQSEMNFNIF